MKIYVACLSAYNNGYLHGKWIDVSGKEEEEIDSEIKEMLKASPCEDAEEWAIHDTEISWVKEYTRISEIVESLKALEESGFDSEMIEELAAYRGCDIVDAVEYAKDNYYGSYENMLDYAYQYIEDTGMLDNLCETVKRYFDYESFARDLEYDFTTIYASNQLHLFN